MVLKFKVRWHIYIEWWYYFPPILVASDFPNSGIYVPIIALHCHTVKRSGQLPSLVGITLKPKVSRVKKKWQPDNRVGREHLKYRHYNGEQETFWTHMYSFNGQFHWWREKITSICFGNTKNVKSRLGEH